MANMFYMGGWAPWDHSRVGNKCEDQATAKAVTQADASGKSPASTEPELLVSTCGTDTEEAGKG